MYTPGERDDTSDDRYLMYSDGQLGDWWSKIRDNVIKPVGRVVAAYYTGGASEVAFKAAEAKKQQDLMKKAAEAQQAQIAAMGNVYPPYPTAPIPAMDPNAARAQAYSYPPSPYPNTGIMPQPYAPQAGVYSAGALPYNQGQGMPNMSIQPVSQAKLPDWAIPAGIGALALVLLARR